MHGISCDRCGDSLLIEDSIRYVLKIELFAAYDPLEITRDDLRQDLDAAYQRILAQIADSDSTSLDETVHAQRKFDLCVRCRAAYLADPFGRGS
ncbi:MAG: hypothetical protein ACKVX7_01255 [Planctomycetota bacterium]